MARCLYATKLERAETTEGTGLNIGAPSLYSSIGVHLEISKLYFKQLIARGCELRLHANHPFRGEGRPKK